MDLHVWDVEAAASRYRSGETCKSIAQDYGLAPQTVQKRLMAHGVEWRGRHQKRPPNRQPIDETRLRELAAAGHTCSEIGVAMGFSEETARRWHKRLGLPRLPAKARMEHNAFWNGGRTQDKAGYWLVMVPGHPYATAAGYVREHRLVMERELGRYLLPSEVVDHIDRNTSNNDPGNLRLFPSNAEHLAATLAGRVPNWTEDGRRRIREGVRAANLRRAASRQASGTDAGR